MAAAFNQYVTLEQFQEQF